MRSITSALTLERPLHFLTVCSAAGCCHGAGARGGARRNRGIAAERSKAVVGVAAAAAVGSGPERAPQRTLFAEGWGEAKA